MNQLVRLRLAFHEVVTTADSRPVVDFDEERHVITIQPSSPSYYLEGLKTPEWTSITRELLGGWKIHITGYIFDVEDEGIWADKYCAEWFYRTFGYDRVSIHYGRACGKGSEMAASVRAMMFSDQMRIKYAS